MLAMSESEDSKLKRANIRLAIILGLVAAAIFVGACWSFIK
jgi:hypothetical protein